MIATTMSDFDLKHYLARQKAIIDQALSECIERLCPCLHLRAPVHYALMAHGKRLRPVLCIAAVRAVGGEPSCALQAACAIEMIHTYSLIHDDLPALDNDQLRRGKPTCHVKYSESTAILAGDTLLNMAFETMSEAGLAASPDSCRNWLQVIQIIGQAAGARGMIDGQARDLAFEGVQLNRQAIEDMHALKTGALIQAAIQCGGVLGGGSPDQISQLIHYANHIGLAFQVVDDILNITGDPKVIGKAIGTDQQRQKNTYPALMGLESSKKFAASLIDSALQALSIFDNSADPLRAIAKYIIERRR